MTAAVAPIVLIAVLFHAVWNALVKGSEDRVVTPGLIAPGHMPAGLKLVLISPMVGPIVLPGLVASVIVYRGYFWLLNNAHKLGDLSLIGLLWFKEGPRGGRILASLIVSAGIVGIGATP